MTSPRGNLADWLALRWVGVNGWMSFSQATKGVIMTDSGLK